MAVSTLSSTLLADDLASSVVTEIIQDPATGHYVREFRFFGAPAAGSNDTPLLLTVRATATERDALTIKTPSLSI